MALAALLGACASQPPSPPAGPALAGRAPAEGRQVATPPLAIFTPAAPPVVRQAPPVAVPPQKPLDVTHLPPFDGERREVREPLRGLPTIDRTVQPDDLWQRIRNGFAMPDLDSPIVQERTAWYAARPEYLRRTFERSRLYLYHIVDELEKRHMPTELALLPMVESSFNPMAYSRAHASGLWQFIPGTGKRYDLAQNWWYDGRRDIVASTSAALDYLRDIYEMNGDWHLALASYNWGENAVARAVEKNRAAGLPLDYSNLSMPLETRHYVPKLQALKNIIANPEPFGILLDPIPNQPYFATIAGTRDIDVRLAAKLAEMPVAEFIALNPGFNRPIIPASVSPRLVLPADRVDIFHDNLLRHGQSLVSWQTYRPKPGEKLAAIAKKFGVTLARLREVNGIGARTKGSPALLVVPINGAAIDTARLPMMYAPPIPVSAPSRSRAPTTPRTIVHSVKAGETLVSIASQYRVSTEELRRWNPIGRLSAGQKLKIQVAGKSAPPAVTRAPVSPKKVKGKPKPAPTKKATRKARR